MERVWAPWRMKYIEQDNSNPTCFICLKVKAVDYTKEHIVLKTEHSIATLNLYPYTQGHILVAPKKHLNSPLLLSDDELLDLHKAVNQMIELLKATYSPQGFNIGANLGKVAGAGLESHYHIHIVPRWQSDSNFMTTSCNTRVMNESLDKTYQRLMENA